MSKQTEKQAKTWEQVRTFTEGPLVVEVSRLIAPGKPKFSISIGSSRPDGSMKRSIPVYTTGQGRVVLDEGSAALDLRISALIAQALKLVVAETQANEDLYMERKAEKERQKETAKAYGERKKGYQGHREPGDRGGHGAKQGTG